MEIIKAHEILINALDYPEPARPEFLILCQKKSGWSKDLFLKWLRDAVLEVKITEGEAAELRLAIELAYRVEVGPKSYTNIELMAFYNQAIYFIHDEFQIQAGLKSPPLPFDEATGNTNKAKYIFYRYELFSNVDLFDFFTYRNVIRDLLLNVRNVEELRRILKPVFEGCVKIVELYNEKIQPVEEQSIDNEMKVIFKDRQISFDEKAFDFVVLMHHPYNQFRSFYAKNYSNRNLVEFAFNVAQFFSTEVLVSTGTIPEVNKESPIKSKLLLLYLFKREGKLNKNKFISKVKEGLNLQEGSVANDYRELCYYLNGDGRLKDKEHETWERYNNQLQEPNIIKKIEQLI